MPEDNDDEPIVDSRDHAGLVRRIERLSRQLSEAKAAVAERDRRLGEAEKAVEAAGRATKEAAKIAAERDALVAERAAWGDERALLAAGITESEGIDLARLAYGRIPEASRPKGGIAEWLAAKDALPKGVAAYLPAAEAKPAAGTKAPPPPPNAGVKPAPPNTGLAGRLGEMTPAEYAASREAVWAELGMPAPALAAKK